MEESQQSNEPKDKKDVVQDSIKKLKEKFVPGVKYTLLISAAVNFAMLVIGCLNVHKCPVNTDIPLFLIATGAIGLMSKFVSYVRDRISKHVQVMYIESALYSVETVFFFLGTYWVYKEFQPSYESTDGNRYCNKTAYLFAFIYVTIFYTIIIAMLTGFCCFICCALCIAGVALRSGSRDVEAQTTTEEVEETVDLTKSTTNDTGPKN